MNHITIVMMGMESVSEKIARLNHLTCLSAREYLIQFHRRENVETYFSTSINILKKVSDLNINFALSNVVFELIHI